jgi:hypothetical protein
MRISIGSSGCVCLQYIGNYVMRLEKNHLRLSASLPVHHFARREANVKGSRLRRPCLERTHKLIKYVG